MPNRRRGEIEAVLDGRRFTLCLTLGALAEVETALGARNVGELVQRFAQADFTTTELIRILAAAMRGGGERVTDEDVAALTAAQTLDGAGSVVAELLRATFGGDDDPANP